MNVVNDSGAIIEVYGGYNVRQHFNKKVGRYYVWLPKYSGLRELFGGRDRLLRSHYVWCRTRGEYVIPFGHVIHHKDHDRLNDSFANLQLMTESEHDAYHATEEGRKGFRRGWETGMTHSTETIEKFREIAAARGNNNIWGGAKKNHFDSTIELMSKKASGKGNPMYRHDLDDEAIVRCYQATGSLEQVARIFGCSVQAVRNRVTKKPAINWRMLSDEEIMTEYKRRGSVHQTALAIGAPMTSLWRKIKKIEESLDA